MKNKSLEAITSIVEGKMTVIASTETPDRMGDSLKVNDWDFKAFKKNPVLQAGHDYRPQFTIGVAKNIRVEGKKVLFEPEFHNITALAREIKEMFEQGMLKAWSVGFIPGREEGEKNELLEVSAVAVPANSEALVMAKGMNETEEKDLGGKIKEFVKEEVEDKKVEEVIEKAEIYNCECIECGHKMKSEKHCKDIKCSECNGKMRRVEKPGQGRKINDEITEEKEGRIISKKTKKIIEDTINQNKQTVVALEKLLKLSEPTPKEDSEKSVLEGKLKKVLVKRTSNEEQKGTTLLKVVKPKKVHKELSAGELAVHTLKEISKQLNFVLNKVNKEKK